MDNTVSRKANYNMDCAAAQNQSPPHATQVASARQVAVLHSLLPLTGQGMGRMLFKPVHQ